MSAKISLWAYNKCSVIKYLFTLFLLFPWDWSYRIHRILFACLFNNIQSFWVVKILCVFKHVLFCIGRVTYLAQNWYFSTIFTSFMKSLTYEGQIRLFICEAFRLQDCQFKRFEWLHWDYKYGYVGKKIIVVLW